ncbi:hypothetical protein GGF40_004042 [Coemansia sp. RSA 1286]|nr:hypothetical protein GGF40_004042 [Coemansia sp. RSA 1286]
MDDITFRISTVKVGDTTDNAASVVSATSTKYAVDESLFDALVDQATGTPGEPEGLKPERTLKQRLVEASPEDIEYLAKLVNERIDEGEGEAMLEIGGCSGEFAMELNNDDDVKSIGETLELVAGHPSVAAFANLLHDSGEGAAAKTSTSTTPTTTTTTTYARDISVEAARDSSKKKTKQMAVVSEQQLISASAQQQGRTAVFLVRRKPSGVEQMLEVRVAVVGNVDAGKSTMLGVLTQGQLDDGRGKARVALFRHKHEIDSGRTSSVGLEILGFDKLSGAPIRHAPDAHRRLGWDAVCNRSSKLVAFLDLAGHEKYLKTTVFGMAGGAPDYVMLMVAANAGLSGMAREHLGLALALGIPVFVVITKIDMCPANVLDNTLKQLTKVLRSSGCRKLPIAVKDRRSVVMAASRFVNHRVCPIFQISNVTGEGVDSLQTFLNILPVNRACAVNKSAVAGDAEAGGGGLRKDRSREQLRYEINEIFNVPYVGTVVSGVLVSGQMVPGQTVWLGPDFHGNFTQATLKTIHRKRVEVQSAYAGQSVSIALKRVARQQVRKGMVLLGKTDSAGVEIAQPQVSMTFEAEVVVLYHSTTITKRYQAMVHCGSVHQTARVLSIEQADASSGSLLRTGDRARVLFQFIRHPEYILPDTRLIFREGRTKGVGKVLRVLSKQEEHDVVFKVTNGTMAFDHRSIKAKIESMRHQNQASVAATKAALSAASKKQI